MAKTAKQRKRSMAGFVGANGGTPLAPENSAAPEVTGTAQVGEELTASAGTWTGRPAPSLSYQWNRDGEPISGATANTYEPIEDDVGSPLTVTVTAANWSGTAAETSDPTANVAAAA
ncbi:hypothetical protein A7A08_01702 [Methyloligella halotolerans]|uniref:Ig-like domain-containing protein n=1 Tax=Methyloligella halotolerans TaxID=1177755 RepID=A0A1E2RZJ9_9HYPH|nr:hypothetical protein [Methyloligella halotolerans]ODA67667.1 hypothetical protein A7A08_01702 [Methyloligella halotolerans]